MRLPDLSDLATHAAFQETMAFGRPWRLPAPDERVYVREFSTSPSTGAIDAHLRSVKVFDETWRKGLERRAASGSLEALLFAQGRPVGCRAAGAWADRLPRASRSPSACSWRCWPCSPEISGWDP